MYSRFQHKNIFKHGSISQTASLHDTNVNYALIAITQEVAELLKKSYPVQADEIDDIELIAGNNSPE